MCNKELNRFLDLPKLTTLDEVMEKFLELYDSYNSVRFSVETLDSIEEVRVILKENSEYYNTLIKR